mgnify:CR=1 FL=1
MGCKKSNSERASGIYDTQQEAFEQTREIAKNQKGKVFIHGKNVKTRRKHSYGNDPYPPKG